MTAFQNVNVGAVHVPRDVHDFANNAHARAGNPPSNISGLKAQRLLDVQPEDRLPSLMRPRGSFTEDEIREAEIIVANFISPTANREILELAGQFVDQGLDPVDIPEAWITEERNSELWKALEASQILDKKMIFGYACIELFQVALANYSIQQRRRRTKRDFTNHPPTAEELESEAEFASTLTQE